MKPYDFGQNQVISLGSDRVSKLFSRTIRKLILYSTIIDHACTLGLKGFGDFRSPTLFSSAILLAQISIVFLSK